MTTKSIKQTLILFAIIIIEGYVVLSTELLVIRQTIPYIGSGTDTVAVIIAAILMPLALGYQTGGRFKARKILGHFVTVRKKLVYNICIAATFLFAGMSYPFMHEFFRIISNSTEIGSLALQIALFCAIFIVVPTYLLGQTVPLISHFFTNERLPRITGHILFFSTLGSFLGATLSTLVFMATLGVHHTLTLNFILMAVLVIIISKKTASFPVLYITILSFLALGLNSDLILKEVYPFMRLNNQYSLVQAGPNEEIPGQRMMKINRNNSSSYMDNGSKHSYINKAEDIAIKPILNATPPKDILVIGAGAFTFGHNDKNNNYTYIDIDKDLKPIAERFVLQEPIGENKRFVVKPARAFLYDSKDKYDVIYLDAYLGKASVPDHLVTQEFFIQVKDHLKEGGILLTNFIVAPNFDDQFSRSLDHTFRSIFPFVSRLVTACPLEEQPYNFWGEDLAAARNVAYLYRHKDYGKPSLYTDNKNKIIYEKPKF